MHHIIVEVLCVLFQDEKGDVSDDDEDETADQEDPVPSTSKRCAREARKRQTGGYYMTLQGYDFVSVSGNATGERGKK